MSGERLIIVHAWHWQGGAQHYSMSGDRFDGWCAYARLPGQTWAGPNSSPWEKDFTTEGEAVAAANLKAVEYNAEVRVEG